MLATLRNVEKENNTFDHSDLKVCPNFVHVWYDFVVANVQFGET